MTCEEMIRYLSDYIDRDLSEELTAEARAHLATCPNCSVVLDSTQRTILLFRERGREVQVPPARRTALFAHLASVLQEQESD